MTDTEQLADVIALSVHLAVEPLIAENKALVAKVAALETRPVVQGRDGKDADLTLIADLRTELAAVRAELLAIKAWPAPKDGRDGASVTVADVAPLIVAEVTKAVAAIPAPTDGRDGINGKDGGPGPAGVPGERGAAGPQGPAGAPGPQGEAGAAGPAGPQGEQGTPGEHGPEGPVGAPGLNGKDGTPGERGGVGPDGAPGRDGRDGLPGVQGEKGADGINGKDGANGLDGKNGADGLGFDDLDVAFDADKGWFLRFVRGDQMKEFPIAVPFDAGVWQSGRTYPKGAGVTVKGAFFIAQQRTAARPDDGSVESRAWRLSVKGGRDGKPGRDGRDLTERSDG